MVQRIESHADLHVRTCQLVGGFSECIWVGGCMCACVYGGGCLYACMRSHACRLIERMQIFLHHCNKCIVYIFSLTWLDQNVFLYPPSTVKQCIRVAICSRDLEKYSFIFVYFLSLMKSVDIAKGLVLSLLTCKSSLSLKYLT